MTDDLGTILKLDDGTLRLEYLRFYPHPVAKVWRALTDPEQTQLWWAQARGSLRPGGQWDLRWLNTPPDEEPMDWWTGSVLEVQSERLFELENSAHGVLRWELSAAQRERNGEVVAGTELKFSCTLKGAIEQAASSMAGWHVHLEHLAAMLKGDQIDWDNWYSVHLPQWQAVMPAYEKIVGAAG